MMRRTIYLDLPKSSKKTVGRTFLSEPVRKFGCIGGADIPVCIAWRSEGHS